jgi:hypothetical protein
MSGGGGKRGERERTPGNLCCLGSVRKEQRLGGGEIMEWRDLHPRSVYNQPTNHLLRCALIAQHQVIPEQDGPKRQKKGSLISSTSQRLV